MTCIIGIRSSTGRISLGANSELSWGYEKHHVSKIIVHGEVGFAWTGLGAVMEVIRHRLSVPEVSEAKLDRYLFRDLPDAIREALKGVDLWDPSEGVRGGGAGIVAWRGRLVSLDGRLAAYSAERGFVAHGSGGATAIGAVAALLATQFTDTQTILKVALRVASEWCQGVGGTPSIVHIERVAT